MRRALTRLGAGLLGVLCLPLLLAAVVVAGAATPAGRAAIERLIPMLTDGEVRIAGLSGWVFHGFGVERLELRDKDGAWLTADAVRVAWSPLPLLHGTVQVDRVQAARVTMARRPLPVASNGGGLPLHVNVAGFDVPDVNLAAPVMGQQATLAATGSLRLDGSDNAAAKLQVRQRDAGGTYSMDAAIAPTGVHAVLRAAEPAGGLIASLADLPTIGAIRAQATLDGPLDAVATKLELEAGPLRATAGGTVDTVRETADITVDATAPAMSPRPGLSWRSVSLRGRIQGAFAAPTLDATLVADGVTSADAEIDRAGVTVTGDLGRINLDGTLQRVRLPGPQPNLLASEPIRLTGSLRMNAPDWPLRLAIAHPLFRIDAEATLAGTRQGEARISVPEVAPFANAAGIAVAGKLAVTVQAVLQQDQTQVTASGHISVSQGPGPTVALLGADTSLDLAAAVRGRTVTLSRLEIGSGALSAGAAGTVASGGVDLNWHVALNDIASVEARLNGPVQASGTVKGAPDDLAVTATAEGDVGAAGIPRGRVGVQLALAHVPGAPSGKAEATGTLLGAPLRLEITGKQTGDVTDLVIDQAAWKSLRAQGTLQVTLPSVLPMGELRFSFERLDDLAPLLGRDIAGSVSGTVDGTPQGIQLAATAEQVALAGIASVGHAVIKAHIADPTGHPSVDASMLADRISAGGIGGTIQASARGPVDALALTLAASSPDLRGAAARLDAAAMLNGTARVLALSSLRADWKRLSARLLGPARIAMGNGLDVQNLRLGVEHAVVTVNGRISPTLDLTARLQDLPAGMAALIDPNLKASGTIAGDARLTGSVSRPVGTIRVTGQALRLASAGGAFPAASVTATANLEGTTARIDARAQAGGSHLVVTGSAGLSGTHGLDLRASGNVDLGMADPLLAAGGRRVRGRLTLDATVAGAASAPRVTGGGRLLNGEYRDFGLGIDLSAIDARIEATGGTIRVASLRAKAGPGTISGGGTIDLTSPAMPVDITLAAHDARPIASQVLTANLDANLTLRGELRGALNLGGTVFVRRADIRIPEQMPASIPVLDVRVPGQRPPPPPTPPPSIGLDLAVDAPQQIFVRGRGVDAELGGQIRLSGTTAKPVGAGGLHLRRGSFSMAGQTLTFSSGEVGFNGGSLTDPSIDFVSNVTTGQVTATLTISGSADHPKIVLSSTPPLPQDQILAYLLYGQPTAKLGPLEIAQIAATLASLSGAAPSGLSNPLENVRQALGLDRLSVGAGQQVQAGRYIARNVYVGAQQSINGTGTQGVVQIDLAKGLRLQATAGTATTQSATGVGGSNANAASVGITYQFNY
jgi:translocation and assembly module TamB